MNLIGEIDFVSIVALAIFLGTLIFTELIVRISQGALRKHFH